MLVLFVLMCGLGCQQELHGEELCVTVEAGESCPSYKEIEERFTREPGTQSCLYDYVSVEAGPQRRHTGAADTGDTGVTWPGICCYDAAVEYGPFIC
jgi:hypothetical protein